MAFLYDGTTDVVPDTVDGSDAAGTDIVFAFATAGRGPAASGLLTGWEAGRGGMAAAGAPGPDGVVRQRPTHGSVVLDAGAGRSRTEPGNATGSGHFPRLRFRSWRSKTRYGTPHVSAGGWRAET